jgi:hypothetical protein
MVVRFRGGGESEYGVVFDQQTTPGLRWFGESELCPSFDGLLRRHNNRKLFPENGGI